MPGGLPWDDPDAEPLEDIRAVARGFEDGTYDKMPLSSYDFGELIYTLDPDGGAERMRELMGEGRTGYIVQRTGPGRVDPETGETIWEPGDVVNVYPVTVAPPLVPTRWERIRGWVRDLFRRRPPDGGEDFQIRFTAS